MPKKVSGYQGIKEFRVLGFMVSGSLTSCGKLDRADDGSQFLVASQAS